MGKLVFKYGVMGSAKSAELLIKAFNHEERGLNILCLKPETDTRDAGVIKSRIEGLCRQVFAFNKDSSLYDYVNYIETISDTSLNTIFIDEVQFMTESQTEELIKLSIDYDYNIICYGLKTDFSGKMFPASQRLIEMADELTEIESMCECGNKAIINARISSHGDIIRTGEQIMVGGNETYHPLCKKCFFTINNLNER